MGAVFLHRLHDQLKSLRFQVSLVVLLLFFVANGLIYSSKIHRLANELGQLMADNEAEYAQVKTLDGAVGTRFEASTRPLGTEFMAEGGFYWFDNGFSVTAETGLSAPYSTSRLTLNNWLDPYEIVDWVFIVRLVLSFLCLVLAYDAVSEDLDTGLLRLILANPLSRGCYLVARFLADGAVVMVSLVLGTLVSLLILTLNGAVEPGAFLLRQYGLFLLASALYAAALLLLAYGVSTLARSSATSLVSLLLLWAVLIVVVPQAAYLLGVDSVQSRNWYGTRQWERYDQFREAMQRQGIVPRDREAGRADGYAVEREYAQGLQEVEALGDQLQRELHGREFNQFRQTQARALLSPGAAYQYTVDAFLGTGVSKFQYFYNQGWTYRQTLRDFFRVRDAVDPDSPHVLFLSRYMSSLPLASGDLPRFQERRLPLADSLAAGLPAILLLVLEAGGAFLFAFWAFRRLDLTG